MIFISVVQFDWDQGSLGCTSRESTNVLISHFFLIMLYPQFFLFCCVGLSLAWTWKHFNTYPISICTDFSQRNGSMAVLSLVACCQLSNSLLSQCAHDAFPTTVIGYSQKQKGPTQTFLPFIFFPHTFSQRYCKSTLSVHQIHYMMLCRDDP